MSKIRDERLAELEAWAANYGPEARELMNVHEVRDLARMALRAQGGVRVKPLEWTQIRENHWRADTAFGPWEVCNQSMFGRPWRTFSPTGWKTYHGDDPEELKRLAEQEVSKRILSSLGASPAPVSEEWLDPSIAPKDGTIVRLLVKPDMEAFTSLQDSEDAFETIGFNHSDESGEDTWHFAGWDWAHDCITQGHGEVIGWAAFSSLAALAAKGGQ
jgi:hypothetical protein